MHRRVSLLVFLAAAFAAFSALPIHGAGFEIEDRESVYGILDPAGNITDLTVVDWLRVRGHGEATVIDPGELSDVKNVKGPERPVKVQGGLSWRIRCRNGFNDIFYSGRTSKPLPLEVKIAYILNGKEVPAAKVGGAKGELVVKITLNNRLRAAERLVYQNSRGESVSAQEDFCVPMVVNITTDVPSARFSQIEAPEGTCTATGATVKISWIVFPYPSTQLTLRLTSEDKIRLEPIYFVIAPRVPPLPEVDLRGQVGELVQGLGQLDSGLAELADGAGRLYSGQAQLTQGMGALQAGLADLRRLNEAHQMIVKQTNDELAAVDLDGLASSLGRLAELEQGLGQLDEGLANLSKLNEGHRTIVATIRAELTGFDPEPAKKSLRSLREFGESMADADKYLSKAAFSYGIQTNLARVARDRQGDILSKLERLAADNPGLSKTETYAELLRMAKIQRDSLNSMVNGGKDNGRSYDGMVYTSKVLNGLAKKIQDGRAGLAEMNSMGERIEGFFGSLERLRQALKVLAEGGAIDGKSVPGLDKAGEGLAKAREGTAMMRSGLGAASGQRSLLAKARDGVALLRTVMEVLAKGGSIQGQQVPGLDTAGQGLAQVDEGLDQLEAGIGLSSQGALQLKDGAVKARTTGTQRMYQAVTAANDDLNKGEALKKAIAARVQAYDHFIGKPNGAKGEVRFLLRTEGLR